MLKEKQISIFKELLDLSKYKTKEISLNGEVPSNNINA